MKTLLRAMSVSFLFTVSAFAVETALQSKGPGPNFEQNKADIIKQIDQRITRTQEEKSCVEAALNQNDLKACRDKFKTEAQAQRSSSKK